MILTKFIIDIDFLLFRFNNCIFKKEIKIEDMSAYKALFTELDRCEYIADYLYTGPLSDYTYNGITYEQSSEAYSRLLEKLYLDFLYEWGTLSDTERESAKEIMEFIISKRYMDNGFYFDTPSVETINAMSLDSGVSKRDIQMAYFINEMSKHQKFYLNKVADFLNIRVVNKNNTVIETISNDVDTKIDITNKSASTCEKEWITYDELVQTFDFRGVKSAKDAAWRKKNGFDMCVSQSGGKGSAVKYSITKINEWLMNGKVSKR